MPSADRRRSPSGNNASSARTVDAKAKRLPSWNHTADLTPMRSRTTTTLRRRQSTIANANIPRSFGSTPSMPNAA